MPHSGDCIMSVLGPTYGYMDRSGVLLAWLQAQVGVSSNVLLEAWEQLFDEAGIAVGPHNERLFTWLGDQGATGDTLGDRWNDYWCNIA